VKFRSCAFFCLVLAALHQPAFAQAPISIGLQAGRACQQGRRNCAGNFIAPTLSLDLSDRIVLRMRRFVFEIPDRTLTNQGVSMDLSHIERRMLLGDFIVRFRSGKIARPIVGVSVASRRDSTTVACSPGPCGTGAQFVHEGPTIHSSTGLLAGVQYHLTKFLNVETSIGLHDPFREEGGTTEAGVLVTLKLWK